MVAGSVFAIALSLVTIHPFSSPAATTSAVTRVFNKWVMVSDQRTARVSYSSTILTSATLLAGQTGRVILEISPDSTNNILVLDAGEQGLKLGLVNPGTSGTVKIVGVIPVTYYMRLRSQNVEGAPTYSSFNGTTTTNNSGFGTETLYD